MSSDKSDFNLDLEVAIEKYLSQQITQDQLAAIFYVDPRLANIVANNSTIHGMIRQMDEIKHDVITFFFSRYADEIKRGVGVYSLLYAITQNLCRERQRDQATEAGRYVDLDDTFSENVETDQNSNTGIMDLTYAGERLLVDDNFADRAERKVDRQLAVALFAEKMSNVPIPFAVDLSEPASSASFGMMKTTQAKSAPEPSHIEFEKIFNEVQMTQKEFAAALNDIKVTRLASYLYKRTKYVPDEIMDLARIVHATQMPEVRILNAKYGGKKISELVAGWKMILRPHTNLSLADVLEVSDVTVSRWEKDECTPSLRQIAKYETAITLKLEMLAAS